MTGRAREYTLYGSQGSGSAAIEAALAICGAPFRIVDAAPWDPASARAELEHVNPLLEIPALVLPDGAALTESAAILIHLGLAHAGSGLLPRKPAERDQAIRGLVFIAVNCYGAIGVIDHPERWCAGGTPAMKERLRRGARHRLHQRWQVFADLFPASGPFLGGATPGSLDLLAGVVSKWSGARRHLRTARPAFAELLDRIDAHPRVAPVFARHWPA